jgi:ABC-type siderophore export system fused ATPase/permease subunit
MSKRDEVKFTKEEIENSKRIFKSATPKYTIDWYVKWVASSIILTAMSIRGVVGWEQADLILSSIGVFLWLIVSFLWKDRALILLNGVGLLFLLRNLFNSLSG